jgi:hypothetical protein
MYDRRLTRLLLLPSLLSGTAVLLISLGLLGYHAWLYISDNQLYYEYLFGAYGLKTYVWQSSAGISAWQSAFLSSPTAYYMLVGGVAIAAGLAAYTALQWWSLLFRGSAMVWYELRAPGLSHWEIAKELLGRLGMRSLTIVGWGVYAAFTFSTILPFVIILNQVGVSAVANNHWAGWLACGGAWLLSAFILHLHIVFMRLAFLKPRLFGGDLAIEEAEATTEDHNAE